MPFRFSIKWLLAIMVYGAIAAAALSRPLWVYPDLLWAGALLAFGYALLIVCFSGGSRRASAAGFAIMWACVVVCLFLSPDSVPTQRLLTGLGIAQTQILPAPSVMPPTAATGTWNLVPSYAPIGPPATATVRAQAYSGSAVFASAPAQLTMFADPMWLQRIRAANAVAAMIGGLAGCLLGVMAYRRSRPAAAVGPSIDASA